MKKGLLARRPGAAETAIAAVLAVSAWSSAALAEDAAAPIQTQSAQGASSPQNGGPSSTAEVETVVVTGSRLATRGYKAPTPVTTWSAQDIQLSGAQTVDSLLDDSPQFVGSQLTGASANTVPGGTAEVNLRGFGEQRNLVLVNGRRYTIDGPSQTTDLNTIPAALVKRVEVVTGGSSAVYGSDAITGVVNFILDDKFNGLQFNAQNSTDQHTGTNAYNFDVTFGKNFSDGRGNITASFDYLNRGGYSASQRGGWAGQSLADGCVTPSSQSATHAGTPESCAAGGVPGLVFSGSGTIPNGRFTSGQFGGTNAGVNNALAAAGLAGLGGSGFTFNNAGTTPSAYVSPADSYNLTPDAYLIDPLERKMANVFAHYDISPKATAYMEFNYSNNFLTARLAPSGVSGNFLINDNNPYLSSQMQGVLTALDNAETGPTTINEGTSHLTTTPGDGLAILSINRRLSDVADRVATSNLDAYRLAGGVRGDLGSLSENFLSDLHYDAYYTYAYTDETDHQSGAASLSAFQAGLLSQNGAAPLINPFGQNLTPAAIKSIMIQSTNLTQTDQEVLAATLNGVLFKAPAGPVDFDIGYEWRRAGTSFMPDQYLATGDVTGFNAQQATSGSESVKEFFGELRVPLLADLPMVKRLSIQGAFRNSDYNLKGVGDVWTYSYGAEYAPVSDVTFRAQYQRAIRAPNVGELYGGQTASGPTLTDPCGPNSTNKSAQVKAVCVATGVPANAVFTPLVQSSPFIDTFSGGNPNLSAETSNTRTFGAVFSPSMVKGLTLSVDYYNIDLSGEIAQLGGGAANALSLCYYTIQSASSVYCQAMHRDSQTGSLYGSGDYINVGLVNIGYVRTSGIDFSGAYSRRADIGVFPGGSRFTLTSDLNYTDQFEVKPSETLPQVNNCVGAFGPTCGQPIPQWKGATRLTWANGPLTLSLRHRFIGEVTTDAYLLPLRSTGKAPALNSFTNPTIPVQQYFDLTAVYAFGKRYQFTFGVQNLFDKDPPVIGSPSPSDNTWAATYDIQGRVFFTALKATF